MCGEKLAVAHVLAVLLGSPPRVRGKGNLRCDSGIENGITPACAGKSLAGEPMRGKPLDHPRVCGEKHSKCM